MRNQTFWMLVFILATSCLADASSEKVFYNFCSQPNCADGANPVADLVRDANGNLWGTTQNGGANGLGTVFELKKSSGYQALGQVYSFRGGTSDGAHPEAGLVIDPGTGTLYGTTRGGGSPLCQGGCGTIFALQPGNGSDVILHFFAGAPNDGANPTSEVLRDSTGNLYGTTTAGGQFNLGTVFRLNTHAMLTVLHSFAGAPGDGADPVAGLVFDSKSNLWGITKLGGTQNLGSVFELTFPSYTTEMHFHSFQGGPADGAQPAAALAFDQHKNNLYGTTSTGGSGGCGTGCGTVFVIQLSTDSYQVLYSFSISNGEAPIGRLAVEPISGNLYGTASLGGNTTGVCGPGGCGTAFEICAPRNTCPWTGPEYTLFRFNDGQIPPTGRNPAAGMLLDISSPEVPDSPTTIPPPSGGRGTCPTNCIGTSAQGGTGHAGVVFGLTH